MRILLLILIVGAIAGYFTRPIEATMRERADALLSDPHDLSQGIESIGAAIAGNRVYDNYYVAAKYEVIVNNTPLVTCWGAFQQVKCDRREDSNQQPSS